MLINPWTPDKAARWICVIAFCAWAWILTLKYHAFGYTGWDLALYDQLMWSLCRGKMDTSLFGGNFLIDHANYIAFLLVPVYFFFQSALTLLYLKLAAFFIGTYVLYLIAQRKLGAPWALLFMLGYMFFPPNMSMLFFEFNFENLALPLIFLAFGFLEEKKFKLLAITCLILSLVKENMPLVVMMFGVLALLTHRKTEPAITRRAAYLTIAAIALFLAEIFFIQPQFTQGLNFHSSNYWEFYKPLGTTPAEVVRSVLFSPLEILRQSFTQKNTLFLAELFGPLLIPALLSPQILLLGLPLFAQNLLSTNTFQQSVFFYYASTLSVFVFLSAIHSLSGMSGRQRQGALTLVIISLLLFNLCYAKEWGKRLPGKTQNSYATARWLISRVPPDAGVVSSLNFLPFLSHRKDLYPLGRKTVSFTRRKERLPASVTWAVADMSFLTSDYWSVRNTLFNKHWTIDAAIGDLVLLKKDSPGAMPLVTFALPDPAAAHRAPILNLPSLIQLNSVTFPESIKAGTKILPVSYKWETLSALPPKSCQVALSIQKDNSVLWDKARYIAYAAPLKKEEVVGDTFHYAIPPLAPGDYAVHLWLIKNNTPDWQWSRPVIKKLQVR